MGIEAYHASEDYARHLTDEVIATRKRSAEISQLIATLDKERRDLIAQQIGLTATLKEHIGTSVDELCEGTDEQKFHLKTRWYHHLSEDILMATEPKDRLAGDGPASPTSVPRIEFLS